MPYYLLALLTSSQVLYVLLALVVLEESVIEEKVPTWWIPTNVGETQDWASFFISYIWATIIPSLKT